MVLADAGLEGLVEPVGIGVVLEVVVAIGSESVASGYGNAGVCGSNAQIAAVLLGVGQVVDILLNLVYAEIAFVVDLQGLVFLTALGRDDDHTVGGAAAVDGACRCVFQHLDGLNVVRREVADRRTHRHAVDDIQGSLVAVQGADTTDAHQRVGAGLSVGSNLYARHFTFEHRTDVGVRHALQRLGIHYGHGSGQVGFLLYAVAHYHHLLECLVVAFELNLA